MAAPKQTTLFSFQFAKGGEPEAPKKETKRKDPSASCKEYDAKKRKRDYLESWEGEFDGLEHHDDIGMVCKHCLNKYGQDPNIVFTVGCRSYRKDSLRSHWKSTNHKNATLDSLGEDEEGPMDTLLRNISKENVAILEQLFNTVYYIIHHEEPFTALPRLLQLQKKNGSELKRLLSYANDVACARWVLY